MVIKKNKFTIKIIFIGKIILIFLLVTFILYTIGKKCNISKELFQNLVDNNNKVSELTNGLYNNQQNENLNFKNLTGNQYSSCKEFYDEKEKDGMPKEEICNFILNNGIFSIHCPSLCKETNNSIANNNNTINKCINICSTNNLDTKNTNINFSVNDLNNFLNNLNTFETDINLTIADFKNS